MKTSRPLSVFLLLSALFSGGCASLRQPELFLCGNALALGTELPSPPSASTQAAPPAANEQEIIELGYCCFEPCEPQTRAEAAVMW